MSDISIKRMTASQFYGCYGAKSNHLIVIYLRVDDYKTGSISGA